MFSTNQPLFLQKTKQYSLGLEFGPQRISHRVSIVRDLNQLDFPSRILSEFLRIYVFHTFVYFSISGKRACRFPGDPKNGRITPVKFLYEVGDRILIQCDTGE